MKMLLLAAIFLPILAFANDKPPKTYPIHGSVVAIANEGSHNSETHTYRIETNTLIYELSERNTKSRFSLGDVIEFRIEEEKAWVREGDKEREYWISRMEQKPPVGK
jgi:hypothetical protein